MGIKPRTMMFIGVATAAALAIAGTVTYNVVKSNSAKSESAVTWWVPDWDYKAATTVVAEFQKQNPDVKVELVQTTGDTVANRTGVALDSGNVPDVITESIARIRGYSEKGKLADLSSVYGKDMPTSDFAPGLVDALTFSGATYAVPYRWATNALIYNPDLFKAAGIAGPPTTWAEFEADARKLTQGNVVGTAWPMKGDASDLTLRFLDFALSDGASIDKGMPKLTTESSQAALHLIGTSIAEKWASTSSFELDNTAIRDLFLQGRIAMYPGGVFDVDKAKSQNSPVATALMPGPNGPGKAQGVGWAYIVPKASTHVDAAKRLVAFLGKAENMAALTLTFPARVSASTDAKFTTTERQAYAKQLSQYSIPAPNDPRWTAVLRLIHDQIQQVALGRMTEKDAAVSIQKIADDAATK